jgi:hypothetical protein
MSEGSQSEIDYAHYIIKVTWCSVNNVGDHIDEEVINSWRDVKTDLNLYSVEYEDEGERYFALVF